MVFFNYATMQMAAKIVYYGPGLCGKTTNLHVVYNRTAPSSRGEMVSLETETDRTLFFDLLPLDVGVIGGFKTRLQLYTVPGQVFYNTTRKLVLKGVDGIVFVADSQRPMLDSNRESFKNLAENLAEIGIAVGEIPRVLQFNKRDLSNILTVDEMNAALNPDRALEWYEASAANGVGVFETLKAISKLTLKTLRSRMTGDMKRPSVVATPATPAAPVAALSTPPAPKANLDDVRSATAAAAAGNSGIFASSGEGTMARLARFSEMIGGKPDASPAPVAAAGAAPAASRAEAAPGATMAVPRLRTEDEPAGDISFGETNAPPAPVVTEDTAVKHVRVRSNVDILSELEKLRKLSTQKPTGLTGAVAPLAPAAASAPAAPASARPEPTPKSAKASAAYSIDDLLAAGGGSANHRKEISRSFDLALPRRALARSRQVVLSVRFTGDAGDVPGSEKSFAVDLGSARDIQKLLLSLRINLEAE